MKQILTKFSGAVFFGGKHSFEVWHTAACDISITYFAMLTDVFCDVQFRTLVDDVKPHDEILLEVDDNTFDEVFASVRAYAKR